MKLAILALTFILILSYTTQAQEFVFEYKMKEFEEVKSTDEQSHLLGEDIAVKLQLLRESYSYMEYNPVTMSESRVIEKPSIYYSVTKASKYLTKSVKKGTLDKNQAQEQLDKILNIALNIRYQETSTLEEKLWKIKKPEGIKSFYAQEIALNM